MKYSVLLDTSFLIRLLNPAEKLHRSSRSWYQYFLENDIVMKTSTICIAEYCVKGSLEDLPLKHLQIISFNLPHALPAGHFSRIILEERKKESENSVPRNVILNDVKLFAQASNESSIKYFVTADKHCEKMYGYIKNNGNPQFEIINIHNSVHGFFGEIPFPLEEE